jgi:hypothetical protein
VWFSLSGLRCIESGCYRQALADPALLSGGRLP